MTKTLSALATAATSTLVYRPDIDGLRAFAVLAVVVCRWRSKSALFRRRHVTVA
ncbi:hypothetical protein [Burkholderia ubonensis]|uniref:hypothetical protein n=1 Tax=Burkholderia ubonensis TaxID=101571 RepID=UPI000B15E3E5|nr:hypothetical protein [Burkholderia ubonensis]